MSNTRLYGNVGPFVVGATITDDNFNIDNEDN